MMVKQLALWCRERIAWLRKLKKEHFELRGRRDYWVIRVLTSLNRLQIIFSLCLLFPRHVLISRHCPVWVCNFLCSFLIPAGNLTLPQRPIGSGQFRNNTGTPTSMNPNFPIGLQQAQQHSPNRYASKNCLRCFIWDVLSKISCFVTVKSINIGIYAFV